MENQQKTKNVEVAVSNINIRLRSFGLEGFKLIRAATANDNEFLYKISRNEANEDAVFKTLSEGEKTLISFLYFVENCVGVSDTEKDGEPSNRVIVIDDPISSLSFNSVFDVASLIKDIFIGSNAYRQILF